MTLDEDALCAQSIARLDSVADRHPLRPSDERRGDVFWRRQLYRFESRQQLAKERPQFHSHEMSAQTEVQANPECQMLMGV
jgi:hypothetical protein